MPEIAAENARPKTQQSDGLLGIFVVLVLATLALSILLDLAARNAIIDRRYPPQNRNETLGNEDLAVGGREELEKYDPNAEPRSFKIIPIRRRFPDVILAGVKKCGTKFLITSLTSHERIKAIDSTINVFPQKKFKAEVHFFDKKKRHNNYTWYLSMMPRASDEMLVMEKTPRYFMSPGAAANISMLTGVKVLICLCNPVERILSEYLMFRRLEWIEGPLENQVLTPDGHINDTHKFIKYSNYAKYMPDWLAHFELGKNLLIVDGDNLLEKPWEELVKVQDFLGIKRELTRDSFLFSEDKGFYCLSHSPYKGSQTYNETFCLGPGKGHDHSNVTSQAMVDKLWEYYEPHNEKLFELLGTRFNWTGG